MENQENEGQRSQAESYLIHSGKQSRRMKLTLFLITYFGFGGTMAFWVYLAPLVEKFTDSATKIGLIRALIPLIAIIANPYFGKRSDITWSRFGRRIPYLLISWPGIVIAFFLIPGASSYNQLLMLFAFFALVFGISAIPHASIVPDLTLPHERGRFILGIIIVGSLSYGLVMIVAKQYWDVPEVNLFGRMIPGFHLIYYLMGILLLLTSIPPLFLIKEYPPTPEQQKMIDEFRERKGQGIEVLFRDFYAYLKGILSERALLIFFLGLAVSRLGSAGLESFQILFVKNELNMEAGDAGFWFMIAGIGFLIGFIPAGILADKVNRKKMLLISVFLAVVVIALQGLSPNPIFFYTLFGLYAFIGAFIMIAIMTIALDLLPEGRIGEFMGAYTIFVLSAAVVAQFLAGGVVDLVGGNYRFIYLPAAIFMLISFFIFRRIPYAGITIKSMKEAREIGLDKMISTR